MILSYFSYENPHFHQPYCLKKIQDKKHQKYQSDKKKLKASGEFLNNLFYFYITKFISEFMNQTKMLEIIWVEDNPGDLRLTREALKETNMMNNLSVPADGEIAMEFLFRQIQTFWLSIVKTTVHYLTGFFPEQQNRK